MSAPPTETNVADRIGRWSTETPDAPALIEGGRTVSYRDFDDAVWRTAAAFKAEGVLPGDVIGLALPSSSLYLVAVYALARLGAVQIALPPGQPAALREPLVRQFRVTAAVRVAGQAPDPEIPTLTIDPSWLEPGAAPVDRGIRMADAAAGWRIVRSSGTTEAPKGVLFSHAMEAGWQSRVHSSMRAGGRSRFLHVIDMAFCYGLRLCMAALGQGATVVLPAPNIPIIELLERHRITHAAMVPFHIQLQKPALARPGPRCPALEELVVAGAVMPEALSALVRERLTPHLHVKYGANEVGYLTAAAPELQVRYPETIGVAVPGVEIEIADDDGRALQDGEIGHLRARGPCFPTEYIAAPEASAKAFRDGWFYPGDLARRNASGAFFFHGRSDDVMNCDGIKIVPSDIEAALLKHPAVAEAAAFPLPSELHQDLPAAVVVLRSSFPQGDLDAHCRALLGARAPRVIGIVSALPRSGAGKILKRELAKRMMEAREAGKGGRSSSPAPYWQRSSNDLTTRPEACCGRSPITRMISPAPSGAGASPRTMTRSGVAAWIASFKSRVSGVSGSRVSPSGFSSISAPWASARGQCRPSNSLPRLCSRAAQPEGR